MLPTLSLCYCSKELNKSLDDINYLLELSNKFLPQDLEILICSSNSPPDSLQDLYKDVPSIFFLQDSGLGIYASWEHLLTVVRGSLVAFIGEGDRIPANFISSVIEHFNILTNLHKSSTLFVGQPIFCDTFFLRIKRPPFFRSDRICSSLLPRSYICHAGCFIPTNLYKDFFLGHDSSLKIIRDLSFLLRIAPKVSLIRLPEIQIYFMLGGISNSSSHWFKVFAERLSIGIRRFFIL